MPSIPAERSLFVLLLTFVKPLDEVDRLIIPHRSYLNRHFIAGHFLAAGRQQPPTGGVIIARAESREQVQAIIAEDPYLTEGVAEYHIVEFHPALYASGFEQFLSR